ncbi:hypothetical protein LCGC14_1834830 [marine sediment metagenome]|uniref:Uncharacterized protein n=1 Tax=marine sediment metagenome TaxID=412755 RepID=A0A0F9GF71_9ZZZZ
MQGRTLDATPQSYRPLRERYEAKDQYKDGMRLALSWPCLTADPMDQPGIGMKVAWNDPRKPWKPYVVLFWGRYGLQFGWLWAEGDQCPDGSTPEK